MSNFKCAWGHTTFDPACDACDAESSDKEYGDFSIIGTPDTKKEIKKTSKEKYDEWLVHNEYEDYI
jgi:hypothetical protein